MSKHSLKKSTNFPATQASSFLPSPQELPASSGLLPTDPGVYWFLNANKQVVYVGKSINLRNRLLSYSRTSHIPDKTKAMVSVATATSYITTQSELEALLLEAELIRLYQPEFNIRLKDSKSTIYVYISNHRFPTIDLKRKQEITSPSSSNIMGPYRSARQIKQVLKLIRPIFKWCQHPQQGKSCFYFHIDQCSGACCGKISQKEYAHNIAQLRLFLRGSQKQLLNDLKKQIKSFSSSKDFESANQAKIKYQHIKNIISTYSFTKKNYILPNLSQDESKQQLIHAKQLLLSYLSITNEFQLERIEGYDISHFQSDYLVGSMVVFENGNKATSQYRRFKIKDPNSTSDPQQIAEIISRRFNHPEWPLPNLILIDGGKAQLKAAINASQTTIPIIGLVKKPDRLLFPQIQESKINWRHHQLDPHHPATNLFTSIRNEAHRFANQYQKTLHKKTITAE